MRTTHPRHVRGRRYRGIGRGRLRKLLAFLDERNTTLGGTGTGQGFTVDAGTDVVTIASHGHADGDGPFEAASAGTLPAGLVAGALYWINSTGANTLTLHRSRGDALDGVNPVDMTDAGTGAHTMTPSTSQEAFGEHFRQGVTTAALAAATDIDDLI